MCAGSRLAGYGTEGWGYTGTAGCFVRDRQSGDLGILTNHHVADHSGNLLWHPWFGMTPAGREEQSFEYVLDEDRFAGLIDEPNAFYRVDCALLKLTGEIADSIDPELPHVGAVGPPLPLDLNTMGPLGKRVTSVGSRRGKQSGTVVAFGYEFIDASGASVYTDLLIIGDEDRDEQGRQVTRTAFSDHGDSGKIIVTDDAEHNAVALLWGGWHKRLRTGREQENWTYAIDINYVLDLLDADVVSAL